MRKQTKTLQSFVHVDKQRRTTSVFYLSLAALAVFVVVGGLFVSESITGFPILGPPTAPKNLEAIAGDGSIFLRWGQPDFDGGPPIQYYEIWRSGEKDTETLYDTTCLTDPKPCDVDKGQQRRYNDTNVQNGKIYFYKVFARNSAGAGIGSSEVNATPAAAPDTTPPRVTLTFPANKTTNVSLSTKITVEFSEPMNKTETEMAFSISPSEDGNLTWDENSRNLTFSPIAALGQDSTYEIKISKLARDLAGNNISSIYFFSFTTKAPTVPQTTTTTSAGPPTTVPPIIINKTGLAGEDDAYDAILRANDTISAESASRNTTEAFDYYLRSVEAFNDQRYDEAKQLADLSVTLIRDFGLPEPEKPSYGLWIVVIIVILGIAGAIYYYYTKIRSKTHEKHHQKKPEPEKKSPPPEPEPQAEPPSEEPEWYGSSQPQ